jgi:hypothetical protein
MINKLFNISFILLIGVFIIYINNTLPKLLLKRKINPSCINSINFSESTLHNKNNNKVKSILTNKNNSITSTVINTCYGYKLI